MSDKLFEGIIVPLLSPLDEQERIIEEDLTKLVKSLLEKDINGFLAPSGTGEFFNLSFKERRRIVEIVTKAAKGKVPVISMVGDCSTFTALKYIDAARQAGADAVMAMPPYYTHINQRALKTFFSTLAKEGGLPLWLYHQPGETKLTIEPKTVAELAKIPNIVGIKISAGPNLLYFHELIRIMRDKPEFRVLIGEDHSVLSSLVLGGHGAVATLANILPDEFIKLWRSIKNKNLATAQEMQDKIMNSQDLLISVKTGNFQFSCKFILKKRGIFSTTICSSPLKPLEEEEIKKIEKHIKKIGLF